MLRIYIIGVCILLIAIIVNVIIGKIGLSTWYDFGPQFFKRGFVVIKEVGFLSSIWLFFFLYWQHRDHQSIVTTALTCKILITI